MSKILYKFDDFIDKIEGKVKPPLHKAIAFVFMPRNVADIFIRWFILLLAIVSIYLHTYIPLLKDFSDNKITGTVSSLQIGATGSGNVRFGGRAEYYYFKLKDYKCTFFITDRGPYWEEGLLSKQVFEKGNRIETTIVKNDYKRLYQNTPPSSDKDRVLPDRNDCIRVYGITVNGEKINSKYGSLLSVSYFNNFGWLIPLYIYFIMLTVMSGIMIQSTYTDWKARKKRLSINK